MTPKPTMTDTETVTVQQRKKEAEEMFLAAELDEVKLLQEGAKNDDFKADLVWRNIIAFAALHVGALVGLYQLFFVAKWSTVAFTFIGWIISGLGITAGAHRLWAHRSYKARWPARLVLMLANCMAFQNDVIEWARDHRCHHKWTDTNADPHNVNRGVFFSHMGWLLVRKHPEIRRRGAKLDLSDLFSDPILRFQRRFYLPLVAMFCFVIPTAIPVYGWGENALVAFYTAAVFRYCFSLHMTWLINSAAHMIGYRPYDPTITPADNLLTTVGALGEGGHNYHHTFPQDYRTSEYSLGVNWTRLTIDVFAALGWVYDRKVVAKEIIARQKAKQHKGH
jgi:stearoyl-CoA desaturase (delta-9 desaturase)